MSVLKKIKFNLGACLFAVICGLLYLCLLAVISPLSECLLCYGSWKEVEPISKPVLMPYMILYLN
jgi:hypothetical protein